MQLRRIARRIVTRGDGWLKLLTGQFVDPLDPATFEIPSDQFAYEEVQWQVAAEVLQNIRAYWERAKANRWSGDHTGDATKPFFIDSQKQNQAVSVILARDQSDPYAVLALPSISVLKGRTMELP